MFILYPYASPSVWHVEALSRVLQKGKQDEKEMQREDRKGEEGEHGLI